MSFSPYFSKLAGIIATLWLALQPCTGFSSSKAVERGIVAMKKQQYDKAQRLFRRHLVRNKKDWDSYNLLAAATFHSGLPKKALKYLKRVQKRTSQRSYNFFYQGLSYSLLNNAKLAEKWFRYAAAYKDDYGQRALFELGVIHYRKRRKKESLYWLRLYLKAAPRGTFVSKSKKLIRTLRSGKWLRNVQGVPKPDIVTALYKYNPMSISSFPHFWMTQIGFDYDLRDGQEPAAKGGLQPRTEESQSLIANAGIGIGPIIEGNTTVWTGYLYKQIWDTNRDRIGEFWGQEATPDFGYFPFRTDLLERHHMFFGDYKRKIIKGLHLGLFGRLEFRRVGSSFSVGDNDTTEGEVQEVADITLLQPWMSYHWSPLSRTFGWLYFRKEINEEAPLYSNQSYDFATSGSPPLSLGVRHTVWMPKYKLRFAAEFFKYTFVYNNIWEDYDRIGGIASGNAEILPGVRLHASFGFYEDTYILSRPKMSSCGAEVNRGSDVLADQAPEDCTRKDSGNLFELGVRYQPSQFHELSAKMVLVENQNPEMKEYQESRSSFLFRYTVAFPGVDRVVNLTDKFSDSPFVKQPI